MPEHGIAPTRVSDGVRFRNTEYFRVERGKIKEVDVYFGRDLRRA